jgi:hypothetical protein
MTPALPGGPAVRQISNGPGSPAAGEQIDFSTVLAIAAGVPRSFPFHNLTIRLRLPAFGEGEPPGALAMGLAPGVMVGDSWWVSGRQRSVAAMTIVDADPAGRKLPSPPEPVAAILAACGKAKNARQVPIPAREPGPATPQATGPSPEAAQALSAVVSDYRARLGDIIDRANLPHDLPSTREALASSFLGEKVGPMKPALARAFKPLGYDCHGDSGTFTLRRRTQSNLTVGISMDVGSWSRSVTAMFIVQGLGFRSVLRLPVAKRAMEGGQYPIGGPEGWQRIVENLTALVAELDRSFVPAVEAACGPTPEWYRPESRS